MFTGLVQAVVKVRSVQRAGQSSVIALQAAGLPGEVAVGDSVMVNGACLTASTAGAGALEFDVSAETLRMTTLGGLNTGDEVNVEMSMRPTDRFGGHFVSGHVDGRGSVAQNRDLPGERRMKVRVAAALADMMVIKGSVAVDGVSLTIAALDRNSFEVSLIPHTLAATTLKDRRPGDVVNIECDMIGKWVRKFVRPGAGTSAGAGLSLDKLREEGY